MRKLFYARLALSNLKKNARIYVPYILSCILTVAMTYIMYLLPEDPGLEEVRGGGTLSAVLALGAIVVTVFAVIFLFYTSSFLVKRRKAEFGLLNVLGMEKKHIARMIFFETFFVGLISLALGLAIGFALSKMVLLVLLNLVRFDVVFGFAFSVRAAGITLAIFAAIFLLTFLNSVRQVHFASPVELIRGGSAGEREPRARWLLVLLGAVTLGAGYWMAVTITDPVEALIFFFVAVILVIIGTYCLFAAGSIAILKVLRRSRRYYYRPEHFISVSGMMYRMKQNAAGLANICILSTMVLVMLSTTSALFIGTEDALQDNYPRDLAVEAHATAKDSRAVDACVTSLLEDAGLRAENRLEYTFLVFAAYLKDGEFLFDPSDNLSGGELISLNCLTLEDYNRLTGRERTLSPGQVLVYPRFAPELRLFGRDYEALDAGEIDLELAGGYYGQYTREIHFFFPDLAGLEEIAALQRQAYGDAASRVKRYVGFDLDADDARIAELGLRLSDALTGAGASATVSTRAENRAAIYGMNGALFFLGLFLGLLFIMATVLIMYYKQLSEGYDDKRRFAIMRKVGLERREIRRSVRAQVLTMFYLPLGAACVHIGFAFPFIMRLFPLVGLSDWRLFAFSTLVSVAVFAAFYAATYALTARTYYRIVGSD